MSLEQGFWTGRAGAMQSIPYSCLHRSLGAPGAGLDGKESCKLWNALHCVLLNYPYVRDSQTLPKQSQVKFRWVCDEQLEGSPQTIEENRSMCIHTRACLYVYTCLCMCLCLYMHRGMYVSVITSSPFRITKTLHSVWVPPRSIT